MFVFILLLIGIVLVAVLKKAHNNTKDIVLNRVQITEDLANQKAPNLTILHLSDLHLEKISITPEELYHRLKDKHIELIALTGDFLDREKTLLKLGPYLDVLNQLKPEYGIYAVLGNHDYLLSEKNLQILKDTLRAFNCNVLQNEHAVIHVHGTPINIIGIDDFHTRRSDISKSYEGIEYGMNLVLTHDPNIVLHMQQHHFDYLLAGHFHGGQVCYPKAYHLARMGKLPGMNMVKGLHRQDGKPFYINEGLGQTSINLRMGSRPEITLHQLSIIAPNQKAISSIQKTVG
ncbi:metallophosphoesterase [Radiobacillus deserti]|uniref:Metallophosphoesterase n=1 Tax=Radiobacillus deserti TaxID=2594883 RepID=A0A516KKC2_9BACI|nr:metallophosphoesterase [Radiobacillus deserti]QDP41832.1 metallophosphoesterase [Radiobacillus deserti]